MKIIKVRVATINHILPVPIIYGNWIMDHREFALVRVDLEDGTAGFAYPPGALGSGLTSWDFLLHFSWDVLCL